MQIDGKQLCWLCTLSYKRALAKAKQVHTASRIKKRPAPEENSSNNSKSSKGSSGDRMKKSQSRSENKPTSGIIEIPPVKNVSPAPIVDPHSSEHVVALTNLKETIASLQKRLTGKDRELLQKDKEITELKGKHFTLENELRTKMKDMERLYEMKLELLNKKVANQLKEIASLSKTNKQQRNNAKVEPESERKTTTNDKESEKENNKSQSPKSQESPDSNKSPASNRSKSPDTNKDSGSSSDSDSDKSRDD